MENYNQSVTQDEIIFRSKYPPVQVPKDSTLPEFVLSNAQPYLDKVAFVDALTGKEYNYGEVTREVKRFANALRSLGLRKGRVVVVVLPNVAEYAIIALGIMDAGGIFSGANPNAHKSEIKKHVENAEAKLIVTDGATINSCMILFMIHYQAYGMTEHSCITLTHGDPNKGHGIAKRNSVGFILPNLEVKFIDPETGRSLPKNSPGEMIDKEGWLHTGDIGYIDDDGDIFLVDRIKELIKYKGFQVAPAELEALLLSHHSVEDAAVVGLPDEEAGEIPVASVVISSNAKESEEDIMNFVASSVATYKRIRILQFVDSIPKSHSGKIMRRIVKENMVKKL